MSASDLAPFVAAVLKDGIVANMKEEIDTLNSKLKSCKDERLLVQILGGGSGGGGGGGGGKEQPAHYYYEASLKDGYYSGQNKQYWKVKMIVVPKKKKKKKEDNNNNNNNNNDSINHYLPLNSITELEIRLGGTVVQRFDTNTLIGICNVFDTDIDETLLLINNNNKLEEPQMCGIGFEPKTKTVTTSKYGDGPVACIEGRIGPMIYDNYINLDILDIDELMILHETGKADNLIITEIEFHISMISGCITLLTELGII
jgi:hypothetical protein